MKVTEISVQFGGTVNLGNYENFKIDLSMKAELEPGETDIIAATERLFADVRGLVRDEVAKLESRNTRGWLRDTDLKRVAPPVAAPALPVYDPENVDEFENDDEDDDEDEPAF